MKSFSDRCFVFDDFVLRERSQELFHIPSETKRKLGYTQLFRILKDFLEFAAHIAPGSAWRTDAEISAAVGKSCDPKACNTWICRLEKRVLTPSSTKLFQRIPRVGYRFLVPVEEVEYNDLVRIGRIRDNVKEVFVRQKIDSFAIASATPCWGWLQLPGFPLLCSDNGKPLNVDVRHDPAPERSFRPPADWQHLYSDTLERLEKDRKLRGQMFTRGPLTRLMHFSLPVDDSLLKIETTACDYFDYSSSMAVLKADANGTLEAFLGTPAKLRAQYKVTNTTFNNPVVCGALGVVTLPITQDGYALIFRRGDQVADYASLHGVVGEGFHPIKDKTRSAENDTFQLSAKVAIRRSLKEELGLEKETIKKTAILGLGVSSDSMDPTLLCIAHLNANLAEVKKNAAENSARDRWELGTCEATRWRPRPISLYLRTIGVPRFTPPVPAVLYLGLLHDFDHREVKKAFAA